VVPLYYSVRSLWTRRLSTGLTVLGLAMVVFVFAAVLMLANGIEAALASGADRRNVIVLRDGATSEIASGIETDAFRVLSTSPEVASSVNGDPLAAGERVILVSLERPGGFSNITIRGISPESLLLREGVRLVEGRAPRPGTNEVLVGTSLAGRFPGATIGGQLRFANQPWPVVGVFAASGSAYESEIWGDTDRIGASFDRPVYSSATFRMRDPQSTDAFIRRVKEEHARFELEAQREDSYWEEQSIGLATFIRVLGLFVTFVFSGGAVLGAMITMYAQVANRIRELATLRAIGFRRRSVMASVVVESAALGLTGGVLGAIGAFFMRWVEFRTLNFSTFSEVRFAFEPSPEILLTAVLFGTVIGLFAGVLPAIRAARLPILAAVRGG
jgi:ABC-type antimicrobial peptide transport system permease subunit